jgi:hypothetical protein
VKVYLLCGTFQYTVRSAKLKFSRGGGRSCRGLAVTPSRSFVVGYQHYGGTSWLGEILALGRFFQASWQCREKRLLRSSYPSLCPLYQLGSHWTDFRGICYWGLVWRSVEKTHNSVKISNIIGHFTRRPEYLLLCTATLHRYELKWCEVVSVAEGVWTLRERAAVLRYTHIAYLFIYWFRNYVLIIRVDPDRAVSFLSLPWIWLVALLAVCAHNHTASLSYLLWLSKWRQRWDDNIKMDLKEVGWEHGLDWSGSG